MKLVKKMSQEKKEKKRKQKSFSQNEIEVLVSEVECNSKVLCGALNGAFTNKKKDMFWERVAIAVNAASSQRRSMSAVRKKWCDLKSSAKKAVALHRRDVAASGGGQVGSGVSPIQLRIVAIFGEKLLSGIVSGGDSDLDAGSTVSNSPVSTRGQVEGKWNNLIFNSVVNTVVTTLFDGKL